MQVRIIDKTSNRTTGGSSYSLFKVQLPDQVVMVSEADFAKESFPKEKDGFLLLNEPLNEHYKFTSKENQVHSFLIPQKDIVNENPGKNIQEKDKLLASMLAKKFGLDPAKQITDQSLIDEYMNDYRSQIEELKSGTSGITNEFVLDPAQFITDQSYIDAVLEEHQSQPKTSQNKKSYNKNTPIKIPQQPDQHSSLKGKSSQDKVAFITKLIELSTQKRTDEHTRDRLIKLIGDEIGRSSLSREEVERIIEEKIGLTERNDVNSPDTPIRNKEAERRLIKLKEEQTLPQESGNEKKSIPEPNPKHVADFMSLFNKRDGLKYLTHDYDENKEFEIDKFLISAEKIFRKATYGKLNIPESLWRIVKQFAFDSKQTEWTSLSKDYSKSIPIKIGWATKELRDWSKRNKLHPIRNEEYSSIISDFKRITRIEPPNFEKLIDIILDNIFKKDLDKYVFEKPGLSKADFYSHVIFLKDALETIFEEIKKRSDLPKKKKISIQYERSISDEGYYLRKIIITHYNSFPSKELKLVLKEWQEKGNMGKIEKKLRGYCHWSVETIIEERPTRVNILRDKETPLYESIQSKPNGFSHILTFYYR